jgi:hypothetical protein
MMMLNSRILITVLAVIFPLATKLANFNLIMMAKGNVQDVLNSKKDAKI